MRALTVCQPYAELIASGVKRIENRRWYTDHRGEIAIHAGKSRKFLGTAEDDGLEIDRLPFGAVVAVAHLTACLSLNALRTGAIGSRFDWVREHPYTGGPFCWVLESVRRIEPMPATGQLGLWNWDPPWCTDCDGTGEITDPANELHWSKTGDAEGEDWCPTCTDAGESREGEPGVGLAR